MEIIREELVEIQTQFGDARRTEITASQEDLTIEDLITEEDVVVTLSHQGYVKYQPISAYQAQHRGGKGKSATHVKDEDFIEPPFMSKYLRLIDMLKQKNIPYSIVEKHK